MDKLTNELIAKVANKLNLEPALLKTVTVVECGTDLAEPVEFLAAHFCYG